MDIEFFKQKIKDTVQTFEVDGEKYFYRVPGMMDANLFEIMTSEREENQKMVDVLLCSICNDNGIRIFEPDNAEHRKIVKALPNDVQIQYINGLSEKLFPKKSKAQA